MENERTKIKSEKPDTTRRKVSLAGQKDLAREEPPPKEATNMYWQGLPGLAEARNTSSTTPP